MSLNLWETKNFDIARQLGAHTQSSVHCRPITFFIKVCLIIIICAAATEAILHLSGIQDMLRILLYPVFLIIFCSISLYKVIVKPMVKILEINEKTEGSFELFRGLLDKSNDAIFIIDPDTAKFIDVNYRACTMLGLSKEGLFIRTAMEMEESAADSWAERVRQIRKDGHIFMQNRLRRGDGTTFPVDVNFNFINWRKQNYIVAVARDVTDREFAQAKLKENETKLRKLAQCTKNAMLMMGAKGEITFWNPAAEKMFGYSYNEAMGKNLHMLLMPERFREVFSKGFAHFQKTGKGYATNKTVNLTALKKDGTEFKVEITINPVPINGEWHAVGIIRDASEKKETEADLISQGKAAEQ